MNKLLKVIIFCLTILSCVACNKAGLKERVTVTDSISVLLPKEYKMNDMGDGNVMVRAKVGTTNLWIVAINDTSLQSQDPAKRKEGLELNVSEFLLSMHGKLLQRKDTIVENVVKSDFIAEFGNSGATKQGKGKFILKGNKFITFLLVPATSESKSNEPLNKAFFNSIKVE